jgi:hypothetical protein
MRGAGRRSCTWDRRPWLSQRQSRRAGLRGGRVGHCTESAGRFRILSPRTVFVRDIKQGGKEKMGDFIQ